MPAFFKSLSAIQKEYGLTTTLLGIGPMSKRIVRVTLQLAKRRNFPIMFIASRNQVDLEELGGGYVCSWDQISFVKTITELADQVQFSGLCYVCRDHGGPWQRDSERQEKLTPETAMETGKRSYLEDLLQGFDLLHIDPTKDPHIQVSNDLETVIQRTVALIEYIEKERRKRGLPEISYEVGTEETSGGLTSPEVYESFIKTLNTILTDKNLPLPAFIVGQTGTLVRMTENVGTFDARAAEALSRVAAKHGAGLKEHNADYLDDSILLQHPPLGITAANVAPEFGVVETAAYLELGLVEAAEGDRMALRSNIVEILSRKAVSSQRWRKWMVGKSKDASVKEATENEELRMQITRICGHYVFDDPEVREALELLARNLSALGIDAEGYVDDRIDKSIDRYVTCFNLQNLTAKLLEHSRSQ
jgi:tagatose-1,6-bisphosphate aldolase non-catalytic subunit AgaZ/GatZ